MTISPYTIFVIIIILWPEYGTGTSTTTIQYLFFSFFLFSSDEIGEDPTAPKLPFITDIKGAGSQEEEPMGILQLLDKLEDATDNLLAR
jgi:hypothetical protein